ncbi:DoxX family protein [Bradyrhizobium symbiodeficiens]|uniref:DoxX family protein n=1 Tax=Bradyrhizobium symbiodeficiens TaxID=1404367 RepID=A0ABX5W2J2_9BRAD|nr:DoxX family protein [Bradyrhizobium symbiodeficiens]QDF37494.1 DoxX family protein [Bradyrhizobium symbiodeficiens]
MSASHATAALVPATISNALVPLVGRVFLSAIFLLSGIGKLTTPEVTTGYIASAGLPFPWVGLAIAVVIEIGGSIALILGYQTRIAAVILAVFTLATAFAFHNQFADQNQFIHFLKNVAIAGGLLQVATFGAGRHSLDARLG